MGGIGLLVRSELRERWRALLALMLLTALACGFVLTASNGARRAQTAWSRLGDETEYPDGLLNVSMGDIEEAAQLVRDDPAVVGSGALSWLPANPEGFEQEVGMFAGIGPGFSEDVMRPLIERGRRPVQSRADEITVNEEYADLVGVDVGSVIHLTGAGKIDQDATVVGIHRSPLDIGPNGDAPSALGTWAFVERWLPELRTLPGFDELRPSVAVRFDDATDADAALGRLADQLPDAGVVSREGLDADVSDGISAGTTAFGVLAAASAIATTLLLGFLFAGTVRDSGADPQLLAALGTTRRARAFVAAVPATGAILVGLAVAPWLAALASPLTRTGFTASADPTEGAWVELGSLLGATALLALPALLVVAVVAWRQAAARAMVPPPMRPSALVRLATWSAPAQLGFCAALGGVRATTRKLSRSTLLAVGLAVLCGVAALAWRASATELDGDYRLQGWTFDLVANGVVDGSDEDFEAAGERLAASEETVRSLTSYWQTVVPLDGNDIDLLALETTRGTLDLALLEGRAITGPGEAVVGPNLKDGAQLAIGDTLELPAAEGTVPVRVVGEAVFPLLGNTGFGDHVLTDPETAARLGAEPLNRGYLVDVVPGASASDVEAIAGDRMSVTGPSSPPSVQRLLDAVGTDTVLVAFLAGFGAAVFGFGVITAARRHRVDYAVVRAFGFRRRQVLSAFLWQAALTLAMVGVVAVPAGVALGRVAWTLTGQRLGVVDSYGLPIPILGLSVLAATIAFAVLAALAAIRPLRVLPAYDLRSE